MSVRTLLNWRKAAGVEPRKWGRPPHGPEAVARAHQAVVLESERQGKTSGWRPMAAMLSPVIPVTLVQRVVHDLKAKSRKRKAERSKENRKGMEVLVADAMWSDDSTHLGRIGRKAVEADVLKDRGTLKFKGVSVGGAISGDEVVRELAAADAVGGLPLVLTTDNGKAYESAPVEEYLKRKRVIHVFSRTYCATDNPCAERGMRELKEESGLGKGVKIADVRWAAEKAVGAALLLNARPRASKGNRSAEELEESLPRWYDSGINRDDFYDRACQAKRGAVREGMSARERCIAEREAVFGIMVEYGLAKLTGGGYAKPHVIQERIS